MTVERSTFAERAKQAEEREDRPKKVIGFRAGPDAEQPDIRIVDNRRGDTTRTRITVDGDGNVTTTTGKEAR